MFLICYLLFIFFCFNFSQFSRSKFEIMEIDFLGLNSHKNKVEQENLKNPFIDTAGGVEISLSLSTSSSFNFSDLQKKKWEFADCDKTISPSCSGSSAISSLPKQRGLFLVAPPVYRRSGGGGGFPYDLNDAATTDIRNMYQENSSIYVVGNASSGQSGHVPTVAMARRATLARFLEKRLHRMNQGRASQFMGKSLSGTSSEVCDTTIPRNNTKKKCNNNLKRR